MKTIIVFVIACLSCTAYGFVDRRTSRNPGNPIPTFPGLPPINPTFPKNGGQWPDAYRRHRRSFDEGQEFIPLETSQFEIEPVDTIRFPRSAVLIDEEPLFSLEELESKPEHMRIARHFKPPRPQQKPEQHFKLRFRRSALGLDEELQFTPEAQEDQMRVARENYDLHRHMRPIPKPRPNTRHQF